MRRTIFEQINEAARTTNCREISQICFWIEQYAILSCNLTALKTVVFLANQINPIYPVQNTAHCQVEQQRFFDISAIKNDTDNFASSASALLNGITRGTESICETLNTISKPCYVSLGFECSADRLNFSTSLHGLKSFQFRSNLHTKHR